MKHLNVFLVFVMSVFVAYSLLGMGMAQNQPCSPAPSDELVNVMNKKCLRCHKKEFSTKEDICAKKSSIIDSVVTGRMPKMGSLNQQEKDTLVNWK